MNESVESTEAIETERIKETSEAPAAQAVDYMQAGFWIRLWAYTVDIIVTFSAGAAVTGLYMAVTGTDLTILTFSVSGILSGMVTFLYFILLTKYFGRTLGKQLFGLRVVSYRKEEMSWMDVLFREFVGRFLHRFLVVTNALYLVVAFHPKKRGIHDFLGDTVVVMEKRAMVTVPERAEKEPQQLESSPSV
ncbi:RDD family protein [Alkalicoccus luteus]|uniref:RDD family protein n=1 Tax=Alkalicoccus luteus TaxID=1237094 RepID=A0A969PP61_9BACI|nr:RDD family protein [Alkalicoccus luteus]NJP36990.1 RDD family protein [Alkalicoccus luteus]